MSDLDKFRKPISSFRIATKDDVISTDKKIEDLKQAIPREISITEITERVINLLPEPIDEKKFKKDILASIPKQEKEEIDIDDLADKVSNSKKFKIIRPEKITAFGGTPYINVKSNGTVIGQERTINFVGGTVTSVGGGGEVDVSFSGDSGVTSIKADSNPALTGAVTLASGTNVTLTEVGQTITISSTGGGGGSPGGNNSDVQFNDSGSFGGDDGLSWDNTNKRLGIGTTIPFSALDVESGVIEANNHDMNNIGQGFFTTQIDMSPTYNDNFDNAPFGSGFFTAITAQCIYINSGSFPALIQGVRDGATYTSSTAPVSVQGSNSNPMITDTPDGSDITALYGQPTFDGSLTNSATINFIYGVRSTSVLRNRANTLTITDYASFISNPGNVLDTGTVAIGTYNGLLEEPGLQGIIIGNMYGFHTDYSTNPGGNTIGTYHGIYLADPTPLGVITTNYALQSEAGVGNFGFGTTSPTNRISVNGDVDISGLTASRAIATDTNKKLVSSTTTATELGYVSGVTSAIQTQLNAKQSTSTTIDLTGQTTSLTSALSITSPNDGNNHQYTLDNYVTITAITAGTLLLQVTYTDENSTTHTQNLFPSGATSGSLSSVNAFLFPMVTIRVKPNTAVTTKTTFLGTSVTYDIGGNINLIN